MHSMESSEFEASYVLYILAYIDNKLITAYSMNFQCKYD